jgi:Carboxypeptidase regulatory-like domain
MAPSGSSGIRQDLRPRSGINFAIISCHQGQKPDVAKIFELASKISNLWSLAAFAIAAILLLATKKSGRVSAASLAAIIAVVALGLVPIAGSLYVQASKDYLEAEKGSHSIYRVRVTVLNPEGTPVQDPKVWSSSGGEPKSVNGGWQFDIPAASKPADGRLHVYAKVENTGLVGQATIQLADDFNPTSTIALTRNESATIRGIVLDSAGHAVGSAHVSVVGYGLEETTTGSDGGFTLPAHVAPGQVVQLHAEKPGYSAVNQDHPTGGLPATLVLEAKRH